MLKFKKTKIFFIIAALGLLIFLNYFHFFNLPKKLVINLFLPLETKMANLTKPKNDDNLKINTKSCDFNESLTASQLKILRDENKQLRETLDFFTTNNYLLQEKKGMVANIIGGDPLAFSSILILDKGKNDGIKKGDAVIKGEGLLVGRIIETEDNISYLALLTNGQVKIAAMILQNENIQGIVEGYHGLGLKINLIPLDKKVNVGDLVVTSGLEKNIPKGLLIGKIEEINTESNDLFQNITLKPFVNFKDLSLVTIIKSN